MRTFIYFSNSAATSGKALSGGNVNLMKAGRMDIVIHVIINAFFISHDIRDDLKLHLIFNGPPDPPRHIEINITPEMSLSKKDIGTFLKKVLYKYREGGRHEVFPGCFIEKKSFLKVIDDFLEEGKKIFVMDRKGASLRNVEISEDSVFVIGDHDGLPKKELKRLKNLEGIHRVSVGPKMYFASQVATIINNELDIRGL
ncbi:MAG: hypothetical protein KJ905_00330 [Nanoarchaeota archaeon]|nr:hypothetical protein [Nanoarchaeota archaeon]MBU1501207.1 hypothetical protein [Nanoarchaeota archaeon]MBU2458908.1 hypothetical protein [Nanoarchaeota archaeon]